jgi:hypothetical protein
MKPLDLLSAGLTILFVGLKLAKIIAWSWLWVLSPLWMLLSVAALYGIVLLCIIAAARSFR